MGDENHDPLVKGSGDDCWVICRECGYVASDRRPDEYLPGVLKISTSRSNAGRIAREHRRQASPSQEGTNDG